jgi:hypothetical protein
VYRVSTESAGRKVKCRHCEALLSVPFPEESKTAVQSGHNPGKKDKTEKRKRKKGRAKDWASMTLEERLGLTDEHAFRPMEVQRGLRYLAYGICIMIIGGMLTYVLAELAKDRDIEWAYGLLTVMYKIGGVWGPVIVGTISGLIPCVLGILNLMGIGIVVWDDGSPLWGTRSGGRKGKARVKSNKVVYIGLAGVIGVAFIALVIFLVNRPGRQDPPEPVAANPKVPDPGGNKPAPPIGTKQPPVVEQARPWELTPDPPLVSAPAWTVPEVVRIGVRERPVLASNNGPFLLTIPPAAGGEGEVWDMRKAQPTGKISAKAYLHAMTRLSTDGQLVAALLAEHSGGSSFLTLWRPGQPFGTRLTIPGWVMWFDFGASADELLILTRTATRNPKEAKVHLQVWSIAKAKSERISELPAAAQPPHSTGPAFIPASVSPGGKYVALLADRKVALVAVKDGRLLAQRSLTDPGDLIQGGLWFSDDGGELTGIFRSYRNKQFVASRLQGWKMAGGKPFVDAVMTNNDVQGPPVPGPEPGTVFLTATALNAGKNVRQGYVVDLRSGKQVFVQPLFIPLRWLQDGRLLGCDISAKDNKPSMIQALAFDREKFKAAAGSKLTPTPVSPDP